MALRVFGLMRQVISGVDADLPRETKQLEQNVQDAFRQLSLEAPILTGREYSATTTTGSENVTITHNLGYAPNRMLLVYTSDAGGGTAWLSSATATTATFILNSTAGADFVVLIWRQP